MNRAFVLAAVLLQVLLLAFMAGEREWVVRAGRQVRFRTAPIDPNDPMRGEYARLRYDMSDVPRALWRDGLPAKLAAAGGGAFRNRNARDLRVYAALRVDESGIAELVSLSDRPPANGPYLRGRVDFLNGESVQVRYGIEALFLQQGRSRELEAAGRNERPGAPIDARVALSSYGLGVLQGYDREPLGLVATFERSDAARPAPGAANPPPRGGNPSRVRVTLPTTTTRANPSVTAVSLEFKNYGAEDVAIVNLPDGGSFRLVPEMRLQANPYRWIGEDRPPSKPGARDVVVIRPGQSFTLRLDLTRPEWFVVNPTVPTAQPVALRDVTAAWSANFRIEYSPPARADLAGLPNGNLVRPGRLLSRAFNPTRNGD